MRVVTDMKNEYDFTKGIRGKFHRVGTQVRFPNAEQWTHKSVLAFAGDKDPIQLIVEKARLTVAKALDLGWSGPPYDPIQLADLLGLDVAPSAHVPDARTVSHAHSLRIEFNPNQPKGRLRYSVAHEIAHTFFPDCHEEIRHRSAPSSIHDDWQLETLCNIAAAELLMPFGSLNELSPNDLSIDRLLELRSRFNVSVEAMLIRAMHVAGFSCAMFCAHRVTSGPNADRYQIDYVVESLPANAPVGRGYLLPANSVAKECTAIGYTAKGTQKLSGRTFVVECVGIPPYPGSPHPRVAGLLIPDDFSQPIQQPITYLTGSALEPRGTGPKVIAHIVNNKTANWGGKGISVAIKRKWPQSQAAYKSWFGAKSASQLLGEVHTTPLAEGVHLASLIAQVGYGPSSNPRVRYEALRKCLTILAKRCEELEASLHIPRIGCGEAGGRWDVVRDLILSTVAEAKIPVTVYDLPNTPQRPPSEGSTPSLF